MTGHLPNAFPKPLNLAVMLCAGPVAADLNIGHPCGHRRFFKIDRRRRNAVALDDINIGNAV